MIEITAFIQLYPVCVNQSFSSAPFCGWLTTVTFPTSMRSMFRLLYRRENMWYLSFQVDLLHLTQCHPVPFMLLQMAEFFLWPNTMLSLYIYTTFFLKKKSILLLGGILNYTTSWSFWAVSFLLYGFSFLWVYYILRWVCWTTCQACF